MFLTGFADEAGSDLKVQIRATKELNWKFIESRAIGDKNLSTLTDAEFDAVCEQLDNAGIRINCYGSGVANWSKSALVEADVEASRKELLNAIQEEMAFEVTPEETQVFGGVFQSLQYMNQTLLNSAQF